MAEMTYDPKEYSRFGKGMVTVFEADTIADDACVYAQNVDMSADGSIAPRLGKLVFGNVTETTGHISDCHTVVRRSGVEVPMRVHQNGSNGIVQVYDATNEVWDDLVTMTENLTTGFADYVTSTYDRVYFGNGVDDNYRWNTLTTYLTQAVTNGDATVNVSSTTGFESSGNIIIDGDNIAYSGKTATTFTGCTGALDHANSLMVMQAAEARNSMTKGNIFLVKDAHLSIAGTPSAGPTMTVSKVSDPEDFTNSSPRLAGEGTIEDFPDGGGPITSIHEKDKWWVILKENLVQLFTLELTASSAGTGGPQEVPVTKAVARYPDCGAVTHKGTVSSNNEVFFVSALGGLRSLNATISDNENSSFNLKDYFDVIAPTIEDFDFSSAAAVYFDQQVLVACKSSVNAMANDRVIIYDILTQGLTTIVGWSVTSWFVYNKTLYFGCGTDPNTYEAFTGFVDFDKETETPIDAIWRSKRFNFGKPSVEKEVDLIYIEGLIGSGTEIEVTVRYDEEGSRGSITKTISSDGAYVTETPANSFGIEELGIEPLAGSLAGEAGLDKFRVYLALPTEYSLYNLDLQFRCNTIGGRWKITNFSINPVLRTEPPAHLKI